MEFGTIPEVSELFGVSLKTVYNYLSKYPDKIRIRKEFWKKLVNIEDFTNVFHKQVQSFKTPSQNFDKPSSSPELWKLNEKFSKLQNDLSSIQQDRDRLQKVNTNLEDQLSKYAIMLREEKNEKQELLQKYDSIQNRLTDEIKWFTRQKVKLIQRYYLLLALCLVVIAVLILQLLPEFLETIISGQ